ncbi:MAG: O-antigen ligase family protein [Candidatus Krumholzibacteria bacterium]|nr:O-antigen ligase family protein [Candidatus Krumholzibacteria bacterium]
MESKTSDKFDFKSASNWQLVFLLLMMTAGYLSIAVSQIALGLALLVMLYRWVFLKEAPPITGLEKTAALLAVWALVMIPFSTNVPQSMLFYRRFYLFTVIWVAASAATTERRRLLLLVAMLAGSLAISIYGQIHHAQLAGGFLSQRMTVLFNAMTSGALLMMAILVAAGFLIVPGIGRKLKALIAVAILPVILGLVMTMTRSAQLGLLAGLGIMFLLAKPRIFVMFLGLLLLVTAVLAVFGENLMSERMWSRVNPQYVIAGENTSLRLEMWRGGLEMVKAHPITGVGDRGLEEISPDYYTSEEGLYFGHLHNNIVQMAVIWGVPGLIFGQAFIWAGLWFLVKRWRALRRRPAGLPGVPAATGWVLGAIGTWVSFYIAGFTEWYFGDAETMLIYLAILGCALGTVEPEEPETD